MPINTDNRRYRIGDFARYTGVTPDFLKHYEDHGLVHATHTDAGYRYYGFRQSARILEYMRLKNCGVSLKDMKSMLSAESDEALALMDERLEEVRRRMLFDAAVLEEYERFRNWYERRRSRPVEWEVREIEGRSFLPHTDGQNFIKDERIYELLKIWAAWMPVVKSGMLINPGSGSGPFQTAWGLVARTSDVRRYGLPTNSIVTEIPPCKAFIYHFAGHSNDVSMTDIANLNHPLYTQLDKLGLKPTGRICLIVDMKLSDEKGVLQNCFGRFLVPVE